MIMLLRLFKAIIYSALGDLTTAVYNKHPHFQDMNEAISRDDCKLQVAMEKCEIKRKKIKANE